MEQWLLPAKSMSILMKTEIIICSGRNAIIANVETYRDRQGQTRTDRDRHGQTRTSRDRKEQTGTDWNRQGQAGTYRDIQGRESKTPVAR